MRCPECEIRNSVAAHQCKSCGLQFKKKPTPIGLKLGIAGAAGVLVLWGAAAAIIPSFTDPGNSLSRTAKAVAAGPKTPDEALHMRKDLDSAIRSYLKQIGKLPTKDLASKLQEELNSNAFEVHAFELPRGLKLVEVDTVLNACDYLVLNDQNTIKIVPLPGMEVFDGGRVITESGAPVLVLVGHTSGHAARRPLIQALALLPGDVADESAKAVPGLNCEGFGKFAQNNRDIFLDVSLFSAGTGADLFRTSPRVVARTDDETVRCLLKWKNGHYVIEPTLGKGPLSPLMALAWKMRNAGSSKMFETYLGSSGEAFARANPMPKGKPLQFDVRVMSGSSRRGATMAYFLNGSNGAFQVDLKHDAGKWIFWGAKKIAPDQVAIAYKQSTAPEIKNVAAQPAQIVVATGSNSAPTKIENKAAPVIETSQPEPQPVAAVPVVERSTRHSRAEKAKALAEANAASEARAKIVTQEKPQVVAAPVIKREPQVIAAPASKREPQAAASQSNKHESQTAGVPVPSEKKSERVSSAPVKKVNGLDQVKWIENPTTMVLQQSNNPSKPAAAASKTTTASRQPTSLPSSPQLEFAVTAPRATAAIAPTAAPARTAGPSTTVPAVTKPVTSSVPATTKTVAVSPAAPSAKTADSKATTATSEPGKVAIASKPATSSKSPAQGGLKTSMTLNPLSATDSAPKTAAAPAGPSTVEVVDADSVKVRSGPATDYRTLTEVPKGAKLEVVGKQNGWYKVKVNNKEGFVYGGLVDSKKSDAYTTAVVKRAETVKDSQQNSVTTHKMGDKVVVLGGIHDGKYKVQLANGKIGFVNKDAIDVKVDAPQFVP